MSTGSSGSGSSGGGHQYTVLVVDDNDWNRDLLLRRLERSGYRVVGAADGEKALEAVANEAVDLLLLDIMMPGLSGVEVLRQLRGRFNSVDLPIVMASAKSESDDVVEALELGANDYVTKPLDFPVVLARIKAHLRGKRPAVLGPPPPDPGSGGVPSSTEIGPGATLVGRYRLDSKIGSGNFGTVYRGHHVGLEHQVAVKVLQPTIGASQDAVARFQREGISACRVNHPNAVSVLDFGVTETGIAFLVMELLEGHSVNDELNRYGILTVERAAEILLPVCEVLAEVHRAGIIHRDIKPANIFLHRGRRGEVVKVLDFGIAKLASDAAQGQHLTVEGWVLGTPAYMAPERFGNRPYDGRADIYSLGVMLYQMLAGRTPFVTQSSDLMAMVMMHIGELPKPLRQLSPHVPDAVEAVVMQMLRKDPLDRPSAETVALDLAKAAGMESRRAASSVRIQIPRHEGPSPPSETTAATTSLKSPGLALPVSGGPPTTAMPRPGQGSEGGPGGPGDRPDADRAPSAWGGEDDWHPADWRPELSSRDSSPSDDGSHTAPPPAAPSLPTRSASGTPRVDSTKPGEVTAMLQRLLGEEPKKPQG